MTKLSSRSADPAAARAERYHHRHPYPSSDRVHFQLALRLPTVRNPRTAPHHHPLPPAARGIGCTRSKFGIADPEPSPKSSFPFDDILEGPAGGRSQNWVDKKEIHLQSCFGWLLKDVVEMLSYERQPPIPIIQKSVIHGYT